MWPNQNCYLEQRAMVKHPQIVIVIENTAFKLTVAVSIIFDH